MMLALIYLVPSIFFYIGRDLITRVFYAHHDSKTPYYVALLAIFVKAILDWILVKPLGIGGISLATSLVTVFNLCLLTFLLSRKIGSLNLSALIKPTLVMIAAAVACYFSTNSTYLYLHLLYPGNTFLMLGLLTGMSCLSGAVVYGLICYLGALEELKLLWARIVPS